VKPSWLRLLGLVRRSRREVALTTGLGLLQSVTFVPIAFLVQRMFNVAIPRHDHQEIVLIGAAIAALGMLGAAIGVAAERAGSRLARTVIASYRKDLVRRLYAHSAAWHDRHDPGVLELTVVQHTERVSDLLRQLTANALPSAVLAATLALATLALNPLLTLCVVAPAPIYVLAGRILGARSRLRYREWLAAHVRFGVATRIALRTMALARVHGTQSWEVARRDKTIDDVVAHSRRFDDARARYEGVQTAITGIGGVVPLVVGGLSVSDGSMSVGDLLAFYSLGLLVLRATSTAVAGFSNAAISSEALAEVEALAAQEPPPARGGAVLEPFAGAVAFEDVGFSYDGETPVLRGVSLAIAPGEHVAIMGPSGGGKTTIVSLLLGIYEPQSGTVRVDGLRLRDVDVVALRRQIGVVMQDAIVFPGTVRDNVAYGRDTDDEPGLDAAAGLAGLDEFIAELPDRYEHEVGEEGGLVSGGQRQRIGIARALMGDPRMLVLDEPTLHLDARSIDRLLAALAELDCTVITVTHDPLVAAQADRVIYVRDGAVLPSAAPLPDVAVR
jgi:ATP-binding cassette subfamily B protein